MAISDEGRREVAAKLRGIDRFHDEEGDVVDPNDVARALGLDWADDMWFYSYYVDRLADLIDVPTTVLDLTETTRTVHGEEVRGWECRECGQSCEEMYGEYEYCPHCGRKVE